MMKTRRSAMMMKMKMRRSAMTMMKMMRKKGKFCGLMNCLFYVTLSYFWRYPSH